MLAKIYQASFVATFALHYAFVLLLVGIPLLAIVQRLRGRLDGAAWVFLRGPYPILISLTITTGVAPLLFSQVAFHRLFYLSFIALHPLPLIGLGLLILFFYLAYAITHWERVALPLAFVQVGLLVVFMIFFWHAVSSHQLAGALARADLGAAVATLAVAFAGGPSGAGAGGGDTLFSSGTMRLDLAGAAGAGTGGGTGCSSRTLSPAPAGRCLSPGALAPVGPLGLGFPAGSGRHDLGHPLRHSAGLRAAHRRASPGAARQRGDAQASQARA